MSALLAGDLHIIALCTRFVKGFCKKIEKIVIL